MRLHRVYSGVWKKRGNVCSVAASFATLPNISLISVNWSEQREFLLLVRGGRSDLISVRTIWPVVSFRGAGSDNRVSRFRKWSIPRTIPTIGGGGIQLLFHAWSNRDNGRRGRVKGDSSFLELRRVSEWNRAKLGTKIRKHAWEINLEVVEKRVDIRVWWCYVVRKVCLQLVTFFEVWWKRVLKIHGIGAYASILLLLEFIITNK